MSLDKDSLVAVAEPTAPTSSTPPELLLQLLRFMLLARAGDRREEILVREQKGAFHMGSNGHEGIAAMAFHLGPDDILFPYYRDRALMHARGMAISEFADDFLACAKSSSSGRNLPSHVSSKRLNAFSITSPVGTQCLPAVGAAWGLKRSHAQAIVTCHVGEASTRQGEFYEAVCFAIEKSLPVVFVVEDNRYGISTPTAGITPRALDVFGPDLLEVVDARDPVSFLNVSGDIIRRVRHGGGPKIMWCELERLCDHTISDDQRVYRTKDELDAARRGDPIAVLSKRLVDVGALTDDQLATMNERIQEEVLKAYDTEEQAQRPLARDVLSHLYDDSPNSCFLQLGPTPKPAPNTILSAVNWTLGRILDEEPKAILFGEDIQDPKGGVFGITKGLSSTHPGRVVNSPLAEATIVGAGVGLAATGHRPIFELQFVDFIGPAYNQLTAQVSNLRWRTSGEWTCPLILYATYGAYLPGGGMWHSQSNEGLFAHIPGIRVGIPSTPEDAAGLFWSAIQGEDPCVILLPKHVLRVHQDVSPEGFRPVPFGKARIVREGSDCTVVSWGNCVSLASAAASKLAEENVSVEVLDLRSIVPCDWETIEASVRKTGRLVVVQEDSRTCGFGQAVIAEMAVNRAGFDSFYASPGLVTRADVHIPYCSDVELSIMPTVRGIISAVKQTLE
ncbi:MAG: thiamine pyrophosphate-dependent enzyme [Fimbriimonas sp.]|nr:thiamine pyrophosphate-dependent enzyme [Fimbriimonas sp.]